ncbi:MAG: amino acid permease [Acidobacteria bacterium]|nr:amino acid permease [Acidobacteriota bacterium]
MTLRRALGPFDATMIVIGGIIGAVIFINPYLVARQLDSTGLVLLAWAAGGAIAVAGAFAYAELGQRRPKAGGQYVYLSEAWHPLVGFLYGWALLFMIETGAMAAVAITFAQYASRMVGGEGAHPQLIAVAAIVLLSAINYVGVRPGSRVLNIFVVLKVVAIGVLILFAWSGPASPGWMTETRVGSLPSTAPGTLMAFGGALIPILFAYGGWQNANYVAEEMRNPRRHLPISLLVGTGIVVAVYLLANVAYLRTLGLEGLAATEAPAAEAAGRWFGVAGERLIAGAIAISTFGFLNLAILAPTRVYFAMARDGAFVPALARLHPKYQTPAAAIVLQSGWAIVLTLTGTFGDLLNTVVFADWIFFGLTVAGLFVYRRRQPTTDGFTTPGFPWLPGAFVCVALAVVYSAIAADPWRSAAGAALLLLGVPVYYWFRRR